MLDTYTCALGSFLRRVAIASSNCARKSATGVIAEVVDRHASFAPAITATSSGSRCAARVT